MKQLLSNLIGSKVAATDGNCGTIRDFYFDDHQWVLRYLYCHLDHPTAEGSAVLVPSGHFLPKEWDLRVFPVDQTVAEVVAGPRPESDLPVSKQMTQNFGSYISWPDVGAVGTPGFLLVPAPVPTTPPGDPNLRSYQVVRHYRVESPRKVLGSVVDFVIDDADWRIHGLIVRLGPWYRSRTVMVSPFWATQIDWAQGSLWTDTHPVDWQTAPAFSRQRPAPLLRRFKE